MGDQTHEGWTNRETWLVNLWLSNEPALYVGAQAAARAVETFAPENLENYARNLFDEEVDDISGFALDLVNAALDHVNWRELVEHFREE